MSKLDKKEVGAIAHKSGVSFRVWAPFAESVAVTGTFNGWSESTLESEQDGYWAAVIKNAEAGHEYKYVIKNGEQILHKNDPRALHVTTFNGNSVIAEPGFEWQDDNFSPPPLEQQVIYELHVGTFNRPDPAISGTFQDVIDKLDYLAELGINMVELMPISTMLMDRGWGYAVDYIYAVESLYGGQFGFMEFVRAAHQRGIGVILDVVYNHFGPETDLWQFDGWSQDGKGGIYFYNDWRAGTPWGETRPDYGRSEVRQYIIDNVKLWLHDCHVDGLRLDSTGYIRNVEGHNDDPSKDISEAWQVMQQINKVARKIKPAAVMIAEDLGGNDYITKTDGEGGAGFNSQWATNFPHALRSVLDATNDADRNLSSLADELKRSFNGNAFQRVIYSDSHDTAANGGTRLNETIAPGNAASLYARKRSLLASALVLTAPGIPMLFQGQEFMQDGSFSDWQALEWNKADQFKGIVEANRHLVALRKNQHGNTAGLSGQSFNVLHVDENNKVMACHRWQNGGPGDDVIVVINFANKAFKDYKLDLPRDGIWRVRFNSAWKGYSPDFKDIEVPDVIAENNQASFTLPPYSALVLSQDPQ
jgi:1,4-alpha-glucan branching enzyme